MNNFFGEITDFFGKPDEPIDDEELFHDICEELLAMKEYSYKLALSSIELGKPQILEYILDNNDFTIEQIKNMKIAVENYVNKKKQTVLIIVKNFETIIRNYERTYQKR